MKTNRYFTYFIIMLCIIPAWLQASEQGTAREHSWLVTPFKCIDCAQKQGNTAAIIRNRLKSNEGFILSAEKNRGSDPCGTADCAVKAGSASGARYVVFGTVRTGKRTVTTGEKESRYLYRKQEVTYYVLSVGVVNTQSGKSLYSFRKDTRSTAGVRALARKSADEIIKKFEGLMPAPVKEKPAKADLPKEKPVPEEKPLPEEKPREDTTPLVSCSGITLAGSMMMPAGTFADMAGTGYGATIGTCLAFTSASNIRLNAHLGVYALNPEQEWVQSIYALQGMLYAGYRFTLPAGFTLTPEAGAGVLVHAVNGDNDGKNAAGNYSYTTEYFTDFAVGGGARVRYGLANSLQLFLRPGYTMFFEKNNTGQFATFELGLIKILN